MTFVKTAIRGGLAALAVAMMTAGAFAWPAAASTALNVRAGPGTQFHVVDVLQRNERVEVEYCRSNWCFVHTRSARGWASQRFLGAIQQPQPPQWQRPPAWQHPQPPHWGAPRPPQWGWSQPQPQPPHWGQPQQPSRPGSNVCFNGPNGYFCFGR